MSCLQTIVHYLYCIAWSFQFSSTKFPVPPACVRSEEMEFLTQNLLHISTTGKLCDCRREREKVYEGFQAERNIHISHRSAIYSTHIRFVVVSSTKVIVMASKTAVDNNVWALSTISHKAPTRAPFSTNVYYLHFLLLIQQTSNRLAPTRGRERVCFVIYVE